MAEREYRCVQRTKKAFQDAFIRMAKQDEGKVTVKALCDAAGLSRNAFYFHYQDINDLFFEIENSILDEMRARLDELGRIGFPENVRGSIQALIDIALRRRDVFELLMSPTYFASFSAKTFEIFSDFNYPYFRRYNRESSREVFDFYYTFISDGFWGMLRRLLFDAKDFPQEKFVALVYTLIKRLLVPDDPSLTFLQQKQS